MFSHNSMSHAKTREMPLHFSFFSFFFKGREILCLFCFYRMCSPFSFFSGLSLFQVCSKSIIIILLCLDFHRGPHTPKKKRKKNTRRPPPHFLRESASFFCLHDHQHSFIEQQQKVRFVAFDDALYPMRADRSFLSSSFFSLSPVLGVDASRGDGRAFRRG